MARLLFYAFLAFCLLAFLATKAVLVATMPVLVALAAK